MERIKIRMWHKKRKEMYYNITVNTYNNTAVYNGESFVIGKDIEVMLWTGLTDANGRKVYDGDILEEGNEHIKVSYGEWSCGCCEDVYGFCFSVMFSPSSCVVIGNKYEGVWQN